MAKTPAGSSALFRAGFVVLVLGFIFHIVGFTTPNWAEVSPGDNLVSRSGLWKSCTEITGAGESCGDSIYDDDSWFVIVRTFIIFGLVCFVFVLVMSLALLVIVSNQRLALVNIYTCVFTVIFTAIAAATFTYKTEFKQIGYSCWLCWISVGALIVAIILLEIVRKKAFRRELGIAVAAEDLEDNELQMLGITPSQHTAHTTHTDEMHKSNTNITSETDDVHNR